MLLASIEQHFPIVGRWMPASSLRRRVFSGVTFQAVAQVMTQLGSLAAMLIAARVLGKVEYGRLALVQSTVLSLTNIATLGIGITATKYISELRTSDPRRAGRVIGLSYIAAVTSAVFFGLLYMVASPFLVTNVDSVAMALGAVAIVFTTVNGFQLGALAGFEQFRSMALLSGAMLVVQPLATLFFATTFGLRGAVLAIGVNSVAACMLYFRALDREYRHWGCVPTYSNVLDEARVLLQVSIPASVAGTVGSAGIWGCALLLSKAPDGFSQLAIFSAAYSIRTVIVFLPGVIARVMMPMIISLRAAGKSSFRSAFHWNLLITTATAALCAAFIYPFRNEFLSLFGRNFQDPGNVVALILLVAVVESAASAAYQALVIYGKLWLHSLVVCIWSLTAAGLTWTLLNRGAAGIAAAYATAWSISLLVYGIAARRLNRTS